MKKIIQVLMSLAIFFSVDAMAFSWDSTICNNTNRSLSGRIFWNTKAGISIFNWHPGDVFTINPGTCLNHLSQNGGGNNLTYAFSVGPYIFVLRNGGYDPDFGAGPYSNSNKLIDDSFTEDYVFFSARYFYYVYGPANTPKDAVHMDNRGTSNCVGVKADDGGGCDSYTNFTINSVASVPPNAPS